MSAHSRRSDSRARALSVLVEVTDGDAFGAARLAELQAEHPLNPADFGLAMELVLGTTRHRLTCEHIAAHFHRGRWAGVHPVIRLNIAMAIYQLCWLDRVPDHAVVDSAVRLASSHGRGTAGRINAILRAVADARGPVSEPAAAAGGNKIGAALLPLPPGEGRGEGSSPGAPPPRRWLPIGNDRGRLFDSDIFPDPARRPLDYLVAITSHTPFLVERWHRRFKPKLCRQVLDAGQRRPSLVLRPNPMRTTPEELLRRLQTEPPAAAGGSTREDADASTLPRTPVRGSDELVRRAESSSPTEGGRYTEPPAVAGGFSARLVDGHIILAGVSTPAELGVFREGLCQPQDATAGIALTLAPPKPGEFVLDLCAGSGTKSTQAAELMGNRGRVLATDTDSQRLGRIAENASRLGLTIIEPVPIDQLDSTIAAAGKPPDLILIDAPCSNTGVLARRPEARYRATRRSIESLVEIQRGLLAQAAALAGPNTRLIYSTCSIELEENESQIAAFLKVHPGWRVGESRFTLPGADRDGGYAALLQLIRGGT